MTHKQRKEIMQFSGKGKHPTIVCTLCKSKCVISVGVTGALRIMPTDHTDTCPIYIRYKTPTGFSYGPWNPINVSGYKLEDFIEAYYKFTQESLMAMF